MLCAKLANPAPAGVLSGRGPTAVGVVGMLAGHGPLRAARGYSPVAAGTVGMAAGHGPLRVARGCSPATVVELRWTFGPHSSAGGQW
jgi:hypothetical protein